MSLNRICIMGRITNDMELKHTPSGVAVTTFRIAVDRDFKDKNGEKGTDFLPIVCWRSLAEFVTKYFGKGRLIIVEGRIQVREFTDREGQKKSVTEVLADNVYFGGDGKREDKPRGQFYPLDDEDDGELPFD